MSEPLDRSICLQNDTYNMDKENWRSQRGGQGG